MEIVVPKKTFFKIVIPNYNNFKYLKKCLDSVMEQTFRDFFVVVVDDQSTDNSFRLAKIYEKRNPEKVVAILPDRKLCSGGCRNVGIDYPIDCEYIIFVDSDDKLHGRYTLDLIYSNVVKTRPQVVLVDRYINNRGSLTLKTGPRSFSVDNVKNAFSFWNPPWSRIVRSDTIAKFPENLNHAEDTIQFLRILDKKPTVMRLGEATYEYRQHNEQMTRNGIYKNDLGKGYEEFKRLFIEATTRSVKRSAMERICSRYANEISY